jgi:hypothetical protein
MPTKTKKISSASKKTVKKTVAKKKAAPKKKVASRKKPVAKKSATKKVATKKATTKKVTKPSTKKSKEKMQTVVLKFDAKQEPVVQVHRKYIWIGTCKNCDHMPMSANKLVAVLSIAIAILSGLLISTSLPMNFEMPSISMSGLTDWIIPISRVNNL